MAVWDRLRANLSPRARIILPEHERYEELKRIWNACFDHQRPLALVQVAGASDVIATVKFARQSGITVTARGGSHSWSGHSTIDGGIVIDFVQMKGIHVDRLHRECRVEPGVLLGEIDHETAAFGLATPVGVISHTGVYGLVLGGGIGWLHRKYGCGVDNILAADIVLADGSFVSVDSNTNPDLFWAIRGAAPNFGIVTSLTLRLHPVVEAYRGSLHYPASQTAVVLRALNSFMRTAPREFQAEFYNRGEEKGEPLLKLCYSFYLPRGEAEKLAEPLKHVGTPHSQSWEWISHEKNQKIFDPESPHHRSYYSKTGSVNFDEVDEPFIDAAVSAINASPTQFSMVELIGLGGAMKEVPAEDTAFFPLRASDWLVNIVTSWYDPADADRCKRWCQQTADSLGKSFSRPGYVNMLADRVDGRKLDRVERAFGPNLPRLRQLKTLYDPSNFFRHNMNIPPLVDTNSDAEGDQSTDGPLPQQ